MIDLRSDTVTRPCDGMRSAMAAAEVGDDVYGEDPTIHRLEAQLAEMTGQEAGLFCPSGTQSNLVALLAHCQRGDEYIVGQGAHTYRYEAGGAAVLGSIQPQPIEPGPDGFMPLEKIAAAVKVDNIHFAVTRLLALENTIGGKVVPSSYTRQARELVDKVGLGFHLDGARAFNAAIALGVDIAEITDPFDSVSICLSKGLGAPVGSVLCGSKDLITRGLRWRKMLGGGMRQAGVLAAAGLFALENNIERLAEDHALAALLAEKLAQIDGVDVVGGSAQTNMVFVSLPHHSVYDLADFAREQGVLFGEYSRTHGVLVEGGGMARMVTHKELGEADIHSAVDVIGRFFD